MRLAKMRSIKRLALSISIISATFILICIILTLTSLSQDDSSGQMLEFVEKMHSSPIVNQKELFESYWGLNGDTNFTESTFKSMDEVRSLRIESLSPANNERISHLTDYLNLPVRIHPFKFDQCRMSNCFNFSRCHLGQPIKVYIVPSEEVGEATDNPTSGESNFIHKNILKIIRHSKHYEPDPEKACIFVPEEDTLDRDPLSKSFRPSSLNIATHASNYGMNYLIFNLYSGSWPNYREDDFAGLHFGAAILAKASNSASHHRHNFDISLPLFSYLHPYVDKESESHVEESRPYFLTFKGKRYVIGRGSETRNNLYHLNNGRDILMLTTCRHGKKWKEASDSRCAEDESNFEQYDFVDLMKKSTLCLTPRGRRLGSFRYLEALSYGCIPVILSDGWIKPFDEIIDWSCAAIQFPEAQLLQVPDMLKDIDPEVVVKMRQACKSIYNEYFSSVKKIVLTTLSIIERRIENRL